MAVALLIPAYQPHDLLCGLISDVLLADRAGLIDRIVVVDDGSGDGYDPTFDRVRQLARTTVLVKPRNAGKGAAIKSGIIELLSDGVTRTGLVTADADGQHAAPDILRIVHALAEHPQSVVLGVRQFDGTVPLRNRAGNLAIRRLVMWLTGVALTDTQTGLRAWPTALAGGLLEIAGDRYEWELRALLAVVNRPSWPIIEVPIVTIYGGPPSHFRPLRDSVRVCLALTRYGRPAGQDY